MTAWPREYVNIDSDVSCARIAWKATNAIAIANSTALETLNFPENIPGIALSIFCGFAKPIVLISSGISDD